VRLSLSWEQLLLSITKIVAPSNTDACAAILNDFKQLHAENVDESMHLVLADDR
jgi:hypothetical protein